MTTQEGYIHANARRILDGMDFAEVVAQRRKDHDLTQEIIAKLLASSQRHVSDIETGKADIRLSEAIHLCNELGIDVFLVRRDDYI